MEVAPPRRGTGKGRAVGAATRPPPAPAAAPATLGPVGGAGALVGYARVSTRDQTPALQLDALRAAGCARVFEETASGARRDRPQLAATLDYMRAGDTLVVWKLDRLARSTRQLIETVEGLAARGIGFRCLTQDGMDTTTATGKLVFTVFSGIAEFERALISERTQAGLDAARARGRRGGRPRKMGPKEVAAARALLRDPEIPVADVAARVGVSVTVLYEAFPGGRTALLEADAAAAETS